MSIGARATGKIAFLGAVASEHLGLVLLAMVLKIVRVSGGGAAPLPFLPMARRREATFVHVRAE